MAACEEGSFISEKKTLCLVTGAGRGLGKSICLELAKVLAPGSTLALMSRTAKDLQTAKEEIEKLRPLGDLTVKLIEKDLSTLNATDGRNILGLATGGEKGFDQIILVNNVGTIGSLSKTLDKLDNPIQWQQYFNLNFHSVVVLTAVVLQEFPEQIQIKNKCIIINITSLAAIKPLYGLAEYCSGKAARELYFNVLALEFPNVCVLSYSPGPLETEMTDLIISKGLPQLSEHFTAARKERSMLTCEQSSQKLISILKKGQFKSGQRIDYFDDTEK